MNYINLESLINNIDEPTRSIVNKILVDNKKLFLTIRGSSNNHQAWPGGYFDHVQEVMNIAMNLYFSLAILRHLPFSLSDALLVLFLHDIEKPWKYQLIDGSYVSKMKTKAEAHEFRRTKLIEYGINLTPDQLNALIYVEGEFDDYSSEKRVMGPLAAFCHVCDVISARIWFDYPEKKGSQTNWNELLHWSDAKRSQNEN